MILFISAKFSTTDLTFSSEIEYPVNAFQNSEPYIQSMRAFCDAELRKSFKKWGVESKDMTSTEYYFYKGNSEEIFFSWEKETETETETTTIK